MLAQEPRLRAGARWMASFRSCGTTSARMAFLKPKSTARRDRTTWLVSSGEAVGSSRCENGQFLAGIEFKSQVGSFGNNYNNRTEEAIGSACDLWAAYREGAFKPSARPWLGYLMLLEHAPESTRPVRAQEPHFKVFPEFKKASYAKRYEILLTKLVRERLYDSACFLLSDSKNGLEDNIRSPRWS